MYINTTKLPCLSSELEITEQKAAIEKCFDMADSGRNGFLTKVNYQKFDVFLMAAC